MNSKSQKLYSKMIAAAVATSAVVVPASALAQDVQAQDVTVPVQAEDVTVISGSETQSDYYNATTSDSAGVGSTEDTATVQPTSGDVVVVNNVKSKDTVTVSNVAKGDIIKVYSDDKKNNLIGKATAKKDKVVIKISKGLPEGLTIYVTKKAKGKDESKPTPVTFDAEKVTVSPSDSNIRVANMVGKKKDTITVLGVKAKDVVKVYATSADAADAKAKPLGQATAKRSGVATVKIKKGFDLAAYPGEVYVTVQGYNERNSKPVKVKVEATKKAATVDTVIVNNNVGEKADTVTVKGVDAKDVIKVYATSADVADAKAKPIGTVKVKKAGEVTVKIKKGLKGVEEVYVTRTSANLEASLPVIKKVPTTPQAKLEEKDVVVNNNLGKKADTITVKGVDAKDVIKVYATSADAADAKAKPLGTVKAKKAGEVTVKIKKGFEEGKEVYVTRASVSLDESVPVRVEVGKDAVASTVDASKIVFTNNVDSADILTVNGLKPKQVIKVYEGTSMLKKATANKLGTAVIKFKAKEQFTTSDVLNITISSKLEGESDKMQVSIPESDKSENPDVKDIVLSDNGDKEATVTVIDTKAKSEYTVFAADGKTELGTAKAKGNSVFITLNKKYAELGDSVQIKVREYDKLESDLVEIEVKKSK